MTIGHNNLPPLLPVGTAVVTKAEVKGAGGDVTCPAGAVGTIVRAPVDIQHSYRIRLVGGEEVTLRREEFQVLKHFQRPQSGSGVAWASGPSVWRASCPPPANAIAGETPAGRTGGTPMPLTAETAAPESLTPPDLRQYIIYSCIVGSRAYGLDHAESDTDRRGVYLPPAEMHWSLFGVPEQLENQETDECYWELQKFLTLALKANPNVLEVLYSPLVEHVTPLGRELLDLRPALLSKLVYQTYNGYVMSQFKKLEQDIRARGAIKWKHAMHLVRLLLSGIAVLRERSVPVRVVEHRDALLAIRDGRMEWDAINAWRLDLHRQFDDAFRATTLPDRPDYEAVNAFLVRARRSMVK